MGYISVIGLEIHAELLTETKIFCACKNAFGGEPNTRVCPICSGMPGSLPSLNKEAVTLAIRAGLALGCEINKFSSFDRKNYFYPDLPKSHQITQFNFPICSRGSVEVPGKKFSIARIHLEEDAGKLIHNSELGISVADFNRSGVPLIEIVTEPDFNSGEEVAEFVNEVALRLKYAEVCDAKLEEGSLRVDVNISVMKENEKTLGVRAEIKNLNSIKSIQKAIEYETKRQTEILKNGGVVLKETRRFNEDTLTTTPMRSKADAHDYRYFPEPDLPGIILSADEIENIKNSLPKMPAERVALYKGYGLSSDEARLIAARKSFSDFYDDAVSQSPEYKEIANLMLGPLNRVMNESKKDVAEGKLTPHTLSEIARLSANGTVSKNSAREILSTVFLSGGEPMEIAKSQNMLIESDPDALKTIINEVLLENSSAKKDYLSGNKKAFGFLMGEAMKKAGKSANPVLLKDILLEKLK